MMGVLTDVQIAQFIEESKQLPAGYDKRIVPKQARIGSSQCELIVTGKTGSVFALIVRKSQINLLDFSIILALEPKGSSQRFLLRRYNGKSHQHTNTLEKEPTFYDFHIHTATERYQRHAKYNEEHYAVVTNRYSDWRMALDCLLSDCQFVPPPGESSLFSFI